LDAQHVNPRLAIGVQGEQQGEQQRWSERVTGKWLRVMPMSAAASAWLFYDMATATEAPRQAVAILQYCLLASALFALISAVVMHALRE
jgi:hypothetical protein